MDKKEVDRLWQRWIEAAIADPHGGCDNDEIQQMWHEYLDAAEELNEED